MRQALAEDEDVACQACHTFSVELVRAHVRGVGDVWLCPDQPLCRHRAQAKGILVPRVSVSHDSRPAARQAHGGPGRWARHHPPTGRAHHHPLLTWAANLASPLVLVGLTAVGIGLDRWVYAVPLVVAP
jgi:hypothetical protein